MFWIAVGVALACALARPAAAGTVRGRVVDVHSRWTATGDRIVSDVTVATDDGRRVTWTQAGGRAGGIGMWQSHVPPLPAVGDRVTAEVVAARTGGGEATRVARAVTIDAPALPAGAIGFVNTRTHNSGAPLHWASGCVFLAMDERGTSQIDDEIDVIESVLSTWRQATSGCSYLDLRFDGTTDGAVRFDGDNVIVFREDRWCRPASDDAPEECYNPSAAAITTLFFVDDPDNPRDAEIVDADIELNGVQFAISSGGQSRGSATCLADLANTLTHEVGHLMGLDHTCWDGTGERPVDGDGAPVPSCTPTSALPPEVTEATMFNFQSCGETKKASPEADDIAGVCSLYPLADDPGECKRADVGESGGCCAVAPGRARGPRGGAGGGLETLIAGIALLALRRRGGNGRARPR